VAGGQYSGRIRLPVKTYQELIAWQKAITFVTAVYQISRGFPREEIYGLQVKSDGRQFPFLATLRKDRAEQPPESLFSFFAMLADLSMRWKPR
jgi:hypothetical protein